MPKLLLRTHKASQKLLVCPDGQGTTFHIFWRGGVLAALFTDINTYVVSAQIPCLKSQTSPLSQKHRAQATNRWGQNWDRPIRTRRSRWSRHQCTAKSVIFDRSLRANEDESKWKASQSCTAKEQSGSPIWGPVQAQVEQAIGRSQRDMPFPLSWSLSSVRTGSSNSRPGESYMQLVKWNFTPSVMSMGTQDGDKATFIPLSLKIITVDKQHTF